MRTKDTDKKLFLLDAYALIFRAYYGFIHNPRYSSKGMNTSAIFGFTNYLLGILQNEKPSHIGVCFDLPGGTFRTEVYPEYKANRDATPEDIKIAVPWIIKLIEAFNIPILSYEGFEADDVVGTLVQRAEKEGFITYMMTSDKDYGQLVTGKTFIYRPVSGGGEPQIWGIPEVCEKFGISRTNQVIDILGLQGDAVDNIPGIPGIGAKTASKLLKKYDSVEGLLENVDQLKGKQKENVINFGEQGLLSKRLATIALDVPVEFNEEALRVEEPDKDKLRALFTELEFRIFAKRVLNEELSEKPKEGQQISLFDAQNEDEQSAPPTINSIENTEHDYQLVESPEEIESLIEMLSKAETFCFHTETMGPDPMVADIVGMSFATEQHKAWYVATPKEFDEAKKFILRFAPVFLEVDKCVVAQNFKYDFKVLTRYGMTIQNRVFDTMVAHYLMNPDMKHNVDILAENYLNYKPVSVETLLGKKGKNQRSMADLLPDEICEFACEDADITLQLYHEFKDEMQKGHLKSLFEEVEIPLIRVLADMEMEGVNIDKEALHQFAEELSDSLLDLEKDIHNLAGETFNIDSPRQLGIVLFDKLGISSKAKKTKTGQYSTGEEVLKNYASDHEIVAKILEYRQLKKLKSTYVDPLPEMVLEESGRVHTNYMQTIAATGRLSSVNPNLQNIPIRSKKGKEIRKAFIPRNENYLLLAADYSQVELRILAAMSGDETMIQAFKNGEDIHAATAAKVFHIPLEEVDRDLRSKAKAVNFGISYGQGVFGLSQTLNISRKESKEIINNYFSQFSKLKEFQNDNIEFARKNGYVETILGRRRYLKDINSTNAVVRGFAERNAINAPIQGSAADVIKIAMINIQQVFEEQNYKSRMIMQVHDELVFDAHKDELNTIQPLIAEKMQQAVDLVVPLKVDMDVGENWLEAH